ncbi:hypothetical protein FQN52_002234 [Onygenales sp. PD_12]|nr:hypothetical protein FQN52_002234 [Onygenales sp. PD_12]
MQLTLPLVAGVLAFVDSAAAHYRWTSLIIDGEVTGEYQYVRSNTNMNSPVTDVMSNDIRCNTGGLESGADTEVATVQAGSTVGFKVDSTLGHPGPVAVYLSASDGDVKAYDGSGAWFKISESGAEITPDAITFPSMDATEYSFEIPAATRKISPPVRPRFAELTETQHPESIFFGSSTLDCMAPAKRVARNSTSPALRSRSRVPEVESQGPLPRFQEHMLRMTLVFCLASTGLL